uniref:Mannosyl-oligosaccharide 1,2-alpha-mannosidase IB n=1 Tax=Gouania willdenowi TaxID=441366 RepID=A0A8C5G0M3_GOUWI
MPVATLLPFTATPSRKSASPTSFRLTEKFILLLVFSAFITLCFGAIFFLPDSSKLLSGVFFHSSAVETNTRTGPDGGGSSGGGGGDAGSILGSDDRVLAKIRKDHEKALLEAKDTLQKRPEEIQQDISMEKEKVVKDSLARAAKDGNQLPLVEYRRPPGATGHVPLDPETREFFKSHIQDLLFHYHLFIYLFIQFISDMVAITEIHFDIQSKITSLFFIFYLFYFFCPFACRKGRWKKALCLSRSVS